MRKWLRQHKFEAHLIAFFLMILPSIPLYLVARGADEAWIVILLLPIVLGNVLELILE